MPATLFSSKSKLSALLVTWVWVKILAPWKRRWTLDGSFFHKPGCILNYFEYPNVSREGPTSSFRAVSKRYLISERRHKHGTHPSILTSLPELRLHMSVVFLLSTMVSITGVPNQSAAAAQPINAGLRRAKGTRGGGYFWEAKRDSYVSGCFKSLESLSWLISFTNANNCWIYGRYHLISLMPISVGFMVDISDNFIH